METEQKDGREKTPRNTQIANKSREMRSSRKPSLKFIASPSDRECVDGLLCGILLCLSGVNPARLSALSLLSLSSSSSRLFNPRRHGFMRISFWHLLSTGESRRPASCSLCLCLARRKLIDTWTTCAPQHVHIVAGGSTSHRPRVISVSAPSANFGVRWANGSNRNIRLNPIISAHLYYNYSLKIIMSDVHISPDDCNIHQRIENAFSNYSSPSSPGCLPEHSAKTEVRFCDYILSERAFHFTRIVLYIWCVLSQPNNNKNDTNKWHTLYDDI